MKRSHKQLDLYQKVQNIFTNIILFIVILNHAQNLLINDPNDFSTIKIADFGLSAKMEAYNPSNAKAQCGTLLYMAPQIFFQPSYTKAVDIWSSAVIMFMLLNEGKHPFYTKNMDTEQYKGVIQQYQSFPQQENFFTNNFLHKISKRIYTERYSVNEALRHPWITRNFDDQIPISLNQSFQGFDLACKSTKLFRSLLTFRALFKGPNQSRIPQQYKNMAYNFNAKNQEIRVRSPSRRKINERNQELFTKMRSMLNSYQISTKNRPEQKNSQQCYSPTIRKHDDMYSRNSDKKKGFFILRMNSSQISCHMNPSTTQHFEQQQNNLAKSQVMQKKIPQQQSENLIIQPKEQECQKPFKIELPRLDIQPIFFKKNLKNENFNKIPITSNKPKTMDIRDLTREKIQRKEIYQYRRTYEKRQESIDNKSKSVLKKIGHQRHTFSTMRRVTNSSIGKRTKPMTFGLGSK